MTSETSQCVFGGFIVVSGYTAAGASQAGTGRVVFCSPAIFRLEVLCRPDISANKNKINFKGGIHVYTVDIYIVILYMGP